MYCLNCGNETKLNKDICLNYQKTIAVSDTGDTAALTSKKRIKKTVTAILVSAVALILIAAFFGGSAFYSYLRYLKAISLVKDGEYENAGEIILSLGEEKRKDFLFAYSDMTMTSYREDECLKNNYKYDYDNEGNCVKELITAPNGSEATKVNTYDGRRLLKSVYEEKGGNYGYMTEYSYDDYGNCIRETTSVLGEETIKVSTYDADGKVLKYVITESGGNVESGEYTYNDSGSCTECKKTGPIFGEITITYIYDDYGNLLREISREISVSGIVDETIREYSYDEGGNLIKMITETGEAKSTELYSYDDDGNCVRITYDFPDGGEYFDEMIYDEYGNLLREESEGPLGEKTITEYSGYKIFYRPQE